MPNCAGLSDVCSLAMSIHVHRYWQVGTYLPSNVQSFLYFRFPVLKPLKGTARLKRNGI